MDINEKTRISRVGDMSLASCAIRLRAARLVAGLQQKELAEAVGVKKSAVNNMEAGSSFPSREVMRYLYRAHRIDFNFILHGDFAQLPSDVQTALFAQLPSAEREWDRTGSSSSDHTFAASTPHKS